MVGFIDFVRRIGIVLVLGLAISLLFLSLKSPVTDEVIMERNIERQKQ
ncbi:Uncharacterised protein [Niallia circulans]|nr:hypothetical protein [Shouchella clausii]MCM3549110.1 hypothetical protein [Shouchella clausii]SPU21697.1 Uncharacterised protein [Niallia circulans]